MKKIQDKELYDLANIYNEHGKKELYQYLRENELIKSPYMLLKRMKNALFLEYNEESDRFEYVTERAEEVFLSVEELCSNAPECATSKKDSTYAEIRDEAMETLVHTLIGDRLLTLDKYVKIDSRLKEIFIDKSSMLSDGYHVRIY